jgi:hypothetical protein
VLVAGAIQIRLVMGFLCVQPFCLVVFALFKIFSPKMLEKKINCGFKPNKKLLG